MAKRYHLWKLRLEHGAITALICHRQLVALITVLCFILDAHDKVEEEKAVCMMFAKGLQNNKQNELLQQ